jgi:acyl-CoA thioester hydrolase
MPRIFKHQLRITWADTDAAQVVHFSNYFRFFEKAEEEFYRELGFSFTDIKNQGLWFPRVEACCQYKKPARFDDLLVIEMTVEKLKEKSVRYGFRIINKDTEELVASGYVVAVAADKKTGKATQIPKTIADKLKPFCK